MRTTLSTTHALWQQQFQRELIQTLAQFPTSSQIVLGCSGGVDSIFLLHLLANICPERLTVITIDHQLQQGSADWAKQVAQYCQQLNVICHIVAVNVFIDQTKNTGNTEALARIARYRVFHEYLAKDDILVLAHHQQDQAETVLLRLLQGTGVDGLAAMPHIAKHQHYQLWRPLLSVTRQQIEDWANQLQLKIVDDPMNQDEHYARVWCRKTVWTVLESRYPSMQQNISRCAELMQDAKTILAEVQQQDYVHCLNSSDPTCVRLDIERLQYLSLARRRQVLSYWLQANQQYRPSLAMVERLQREVIDAKQDATGCLQYADHCFVRFTGFLYRYSLVEWQYFHQPMEARQVVFSNNNVYQIMTASIGLNPNLLNRPLQLIPRQGGERIWFYGHPHTRILKKQLHAAGIAPWLRLHTQLLYDGDRLLGVMTAQGFWLAKSYACVEQGWIPVQLQ